MFLTLFSFTIVFAVIVLPNFLIIGAPRSGTTYLQRCLSEHPQVFIASGKYYGDIHFFNICTKISYQNNFKKGIKWYERLFDNVKNEKAIGEKTAHYLSDPKAPELIKKYIPKVNMIAILRNPIDRAYSEYWYRKGEIPGKMDFIKACRSEKTKRLKLIEAGFYYRQITNYLRCFSRSQFKILIYDDLISNSLKMIQDIYSFLEVEKDFVPFWIEKKANVAVAQGAAYHFKHIGGRLKNQFPTIFKLVRIFPGIERIQNAIGKKADAEKTTTQYPAMSKLHREELSKVFYREDEKLSSFLGRDFISLWHDNID